MQPLALDKILTHHQQFITGCNPSPLHMIVSGTAGTGKSYLISAIKQGLGDSCATTGMAAFNICGKTIYSCLQLPVTRNYLHVDLQGGTTKTATFTPYEDLHNNRRDVHVRTTNICMD